MTTPPSDPREALERAAVDYDATMAAPRCHAASWLRARAQEVRRQ